ncbi:flippase [Candidatus Woesearchaeota archaeon]|nr:flippase [Candidatus Woesearchaeota archaeon]
MSSEYLRKGIRGTLFIGIFTILGSLFGFLTRLVLARNLTPAEFGLFYAVFALFMLLSTLADLGYGAALVKFIPEFLATRKRSQLYYTARYTLVVRLVTAIIISVVLAAITGWLAQHYFNDVLARPLLYLFIPVIILTVFFQFFVNVYFGFQDMFAAGLVTFLNKFLFWLACLILFSLGATGVLVGGWALLLSIVVLVLLFTIPMLRKLKGFRTKKGPEHDLLRRINRFAFPSILTAVSGFVIGQIDTLILTALVSLTLVGIYNGVLATVHVLSFLGGTLAAVLFPMVSELWAKKDKRRISEGFTMLYRLALFCILPFAATMALYADIILRTLFGEEFVIGALAMRILSLGLIFLTFAQVNFSFLSGIGKPERITRIMIIAAVFNAVFNLALIPLFGIKGAAITTTLSYLLMFIISYVDVRKDMRFTLEKIAPTLISAAVFLVLFTLLKSWLSLNVYLEIVIVLTASLLAYALLGFAFKIVTVGEVRRFSGALLKRG